MLWRSNVVEARKLRSDWHSCFQKVVSQILLLVVPARSEVCLLRSDWPSCFEQCMCARSARLCRCATPFNGRCLSVVHAHFALKLLDCRLSSTLESRPNLRKDQGVKQKQQRERRYCAPQHSRNPN
eukprot:3758593-Rhodomonas_salina.2